MEINNITKIDIDYGIISSKYSMEEGKVVINFIKDGKKKKTILKDMHFRLYFYIVKQNKNIVIKKRNILKKYLLLWSVFAIIGILAGYYANKK